MEEKATTCSSVKNKKKDEEETYKITISYFEEYGVIQFVSEVDMKIQKTTSRLLKDAVLFINSKLLVGHFDLQYEKENSHLSFCFAQPCAKEIGMDNFLAKVLDVIVNTQNAFAPCFKAIGNKEITSMREVELFATEPKYRA